MKENNRLITLKEAVMYSNHAEENIRLQIKNGLLRKYDKNGIALLDPLSKKGYFKLSELLIFFNIKNPEKVKKDFIKRKKQADGNKNIIPKNLVVLRSEEMFKLSEIKNKSIDTWIIPSNFKLIEKNESTSHSDLSNTSLQEIYSYFNESERILKSQGNILVHSISRYLPYLGLYLDNLGWYFKYWIVYSTKPLNKVSLSRFTPISNGILYFVRSKLKFRINKVRIPYRNCSHCYQPLKDYGGKKHLRHTDGMVVSDIWHLEIDQNTNSLSYNIHPTVLRRLIDLSCNSDSSLLIAPFNGEVPLELY